jgi:predicted Zn-ribbon and HTH transcriptional regulator
MQPTEHVQHPCRVQLASLARASTSDQTAVAREWSPHTKCTSFSSETGFRSFVMPAARCPSCGNQWNAYVLQIEIECPRCHCRFTPPERLPDVAPAARVAPARAARVAPATGQVTHESVFSDYPALGIITAINRLCGWLCIIAGVVAVALGLIQTNSLAVFCGVVCLPTALVLFMTAELTLLLVRIERNTR